MSLTVTVLGSSGTFPTAERAASGYLVEVDGSYLWMDAGSGTWRNLLGHVDYPAISGVVLSHCHPDHTTDVFQAFHARKFGGPRPLDPIPLWAPQETLERLTGFIPFLDESFDMQAIAANGSFDFNGARIAFVSMAHPPETLGVRIDLDERTLAYSADTGRGADFDALGRNADLFICEATLQDSDELWEGHLRASQAGEIAAEIDARSLLLTHFRPGRDAALSLVEAERAAGGVECRIAVDNLRLEVKR
jgi:ribonuclease BN (tRNA processing enzyme)